MSSVHRRLDDRPRYGPELWREREGVEFCHWDRWLCRLAVSDLGGLEALLREFRARQRNPHACREDAEAMLAQILDLKRRLVLVGSSPEALLGDEERASQWLLKKAWSRVCLEGPRRRTAAMLSTPRQRLMRRALRGHWSSFPVSPERFVLDAKVALESDDLRHARRVVVERGARLETRAERLAFQRALLTSALEAALDGGAVTPLISSLYRRAERAYLELLGPRCAVSPLLRDLLELAVWEEHGLTVHTKTFLRRLSEPTADRAIKILASIIAELRQYELAGPLTRARAVRELVLTSLDGQRLPGG